MNKLVVGRTRKGKTTAELADLAWIVEEPLPVPGDEETRKTPGIVVLSAKDKDLGWDFYRLLVYRGMANRVRYDNLGNTEHPLGLNYLKASEHPDALERGIEDENIVKAFKEMLGRRQGIDTFRDKPLKEQWTDRAIKLLLHQKKPISPYFMQFAFDVGSPEFWYLVKNCTDPLIARKFEALADTKNWEQRSEIRAAERLIEPMVNSPAFRLRCRSDDDFDDFLDKGGIWIVEGSRKVAKETTEMIFDCVKLRAIQHVRRGTKRRILVVVEEANNYRQISTMEAEALGELQGPGLDMHILVQNLDFPDDKVLHNVMTNCQRHEWFQCGDHDIAKKAAEDIGSPLLDPWKVHHTDISRRQITIGWEEVENESEGSGSSETESGRTTSRRDKRISKSWRPVHSEAVDEHPRYFSLNDQYELIAQQVRTLGVGERFVVEEGRVTKEKVKKIDGPFVFASTEKHEMEKALEKQYKRPCFQREAEFQPEPEECETETKTKKRGAAARVRGESGTNK